MKHHDSTAHEKKLDEVAERIRQRLRAHGVEVTVLPPPNNVIQLDQYRRAREKRLGR